jgi:hypothetical protein
MSPLTWKGLAVPWTVSGGSLWMLPDPVLASSE